MMKSIRAIGIIATMGIMLICAYLLGTTQAETVTETKGTEKVIEVIPNGYIDSDSPEFQENYIDMRMVIDFEANEDGLQLYFADGTGYWIER